MIEEVVPYIPTGQWSPKTAYRKNIEGVIAAPAFFIGQKNMLTFRLRSISHTDATAAMLIEPAPRTSRG